MGSYLCIINPLRHSITTSIIFLLMLPHLMCICTSTTSPGEELLTVEESGKTLKTLHSTDYIMQGLILVFWIAMGDSRKKNTFHPYCNTAWKTHMLPCRDPLQSRTTAEQNIYYRLLVGLLYVVWILNSKKNGKVKNVRYYLSHPPLESSS